MKKKMNEFVIPLYVKILAWLCAVFIVGLNARLIFQQIIDWLATSSNPVLIWLTVIPAAN